MDYVNVYFRLHPTQPYEPYKAMELVDGTTLSVQAGYGKYSTPRQEKSFPYNKVEVGYPSTYIPEFMPYIDGGQDEDPTESVYAYVPVEVVNQVIQSRGGIKNL